MSDRDSCLLATGPMTEPGDMRPALGKGYLGITNGGTTVESFTPSGGSGCDANVVWAQLRSAVPLRMDSVQTYTARLSYTAEMVCSNFQVLTSVSDK